MFERFDDHARHVLVLAQEEARLLDHNLVGTEHILLGLIRGGDGIAANTLASLDVSLDAVREKVVEAVGRVGSVQAGTPPFTPRAKKTLELSLREARQLGHEQVGPQHLLLGLVREGEGVAAQVLVSLGADLGRVRQQVIQRMSGYQGKEAVGRPDAPGARGTDPRRPQAVGDRPPWLRCAICGRSLWETAHFATGAHGRVCKQCIEDAAAMLADAAPEQRELVLPPRVSGRRPDDPAVQAITTAVEDAFGPTAGPTRWATTIEEPGRFDRELQRLRERWGRPEAVRVAEVGFVTEQLAFVRFDVEFDGSRGTSVAGQLRRHGDRWLVTAETLTVLLRRVGFDLPPPSTTRRA